MSTAGTDTQPGVGRCGYVALVGRPNVGKSTLLNALLGTKVSIVTPKPHTTRQRTLGVVARGATQFVFVDTPGLHEVRGRPLNRLMNDAARQAMADADVILVLLDAERPREGDEQVIESALASGRPVVLGINKTDRVRPRDRLLPLLSALAARWPDLRALVPLSALRGDNLERLLDVLEPALPEGPALFPAEMITDRDLAYRVAECIREKLMLHLREELPYGVAVALERLERDEIGRWQVAAVVWVEHDRHKGMVIGKRGEMLKTIGSEAREELLGLLDAPVHLELWVRVRSDWSCDQRALRELGLGGDAS